MSRRADHPSKRTRKLSTDSDGTEEGYDWADRRRSAGRAEKATSKTNDVTRPRRTVSENISTATVSRGPPTAQSTSPQSMRLTVKTSSNKLREATRVSKGGSVVINRREQLDGGEIIHGKRARNVRKSYVLESDSDEDEEMADVVDEDAEGEEEEDDEEMEEDEEGLGDEDADGDVDMDIPPPPPVIKISRAQSGKQTIVAKPAGKPDTVTVEQKEVELGSDDEELSELDSELADDVEEEEAMQTGNEEDAEGEEEDIEVDEEAEDDDDDLDSDDETPAGGSRASTPDLKNLTKRQRARLEEGGSGHLLALPDEVQVKKHLTAEEHAMRRAEMARRRKNLSEKRNEEEKMETINKLLKKQAPKTNARRSQFSGAGDGTPDSDGQKPNPIFVRWVSNKDGNRIGVPEEWLEGPVGAVFQGGLKEAATGGKMVAEVS